MQNNVYEIKQLSIEDILPNRSQPRINFDEKSLNELALSIKKYGIIQPLIVRKLENKYEVIAGERRLKAASIASLKEVPAIILEIDDKTAAELAVIENLQRENLNPIELAKSYQNLTNYEPKEELSKSLSKQENVINNKIKLLNLPIEIQNALQNNEIAEGHAKLLLQIKEENKQKELLNRIIKEKIPISDLSKIINNDNISEIDINPNMQKALSEIDIVDTKSNLFNDTEKEIVEGKNMNNENNIEKTQMINIDEIKSAAQDINKEEPTADLNNLLKIEKGYEPIPPVEEKPKFSFAGKFFPSLEDESANMDTGSNFTNLENNVEIMPKVEVPIEQNTTSIEVETKKEEPSVENSVPQETTIHQPNVEPSPIVETPVQQTVETNEQKPLSNQENFINEYQEVPSIETKKEEPKVEIPVEQKKPVQEVPKEVPVEETTAPILRNAINMSRNLVEQLESIGFNIDLEELDLPNEYQMIIKIQK